MKRPNIFLITIDSLRSDCIKYMPNLMKLAEKSIFTDKCVVGGMPTMYSFPSILDGVYPFDRYISLLPKRGFLIEKLPQMVNFKIWYTNGRNMYAYIRNTKIKKVKFLKFKKAVEKILPTQIFRRLSLLKHYYLDRDLCRTPLDEDIADLWRFLKSIEENESFIVWFHVMDVHLPYYPHQWQCDRNYLRYRISEYFYTRKVVSFIRENIVASFESKFRIYNLYDTKALDVALIGYRYYLYACRKIDKVIRDIITNVKSKFPGTIFIITSDHGEMFGEYGSNIVFHTPITHNDILNQVPLIIFGEGISPDDISGKLVSSIDIIPTILNILGVEDKVKSQGTSLLERIPNDRKVFSFSVFLDYPTEGSSMLYHYSRPYENVRILLTMFTDVNRAYTLLEGYDKPVPYSYPYPPEDIKRIMLDEIAKIRRRTKIALEALELRKRMSKRDNR